MGFPFNDKPSAVSDMRVEAALEQLRLDRHST